MRFFEKMNSAIHPDDQVPEPGMEVLGYIVRAKCIMPRHTVKPEQERSGILVDHLLCLGW